MALLVSLFAVLLAVVFHLGRSSQAFTEAARESRLEAAALDDKRLENRAAWKQLGVDGIALQDHDISDIVQEVRKKYPPKED